MHSKEILCPLEITALTKNIWGSIHCSLFWMRRKTSWLTTKMSCTQRNKWNVKKIHLQSKIVYGLLLRKSKHLLGLKHKVSIIYVTWGKCRPREEPLSFSMAWLYIASFSWQGKFLGRFLVQRYIGLFSSHIKAYMISYGIHLMTIYGVLSHSHSSCFRLQIPSLCNSGKKRKQGPIIIIVLHHF